MKYYQQSPWLKYLGLTAQLLVMIGVAVYGGIKLDEKFNIAPLLTIALPLLALGVSFYELIKETSKNKKKDESKQ